jgi:hypothetical protein
MSNIRTPAAVTTDSQKVADRSRHDLREGRILTYEETRTVMLRARQMQAEAIATMLIRLGKWLVRKPQGRAQRISDAMYLAGR